ncbi:MAG: hypothetical protein EB092_06525 [Chitinophagia bacterium]|nr:hypothetical protein [Chitinophagia bacterium]NCA29460.1 hypothetical protein [Chitinophagia bacterium]NDD16643.1 hypothetical protein [Chitinophagia bacterium]
MKKAYISLIFLASFLIGINSIQAQKELLIQKVDSVFVSQIKNLKIPGGIVQIKKSGKIIYSNAYGVAQKYNDQHELIQNPTKLSTDYLYDIASLTKVVGTTTSIMYLVDKGLLNINDPVSKYIPAFNQPHKDSITIRNLLTHTAGILEWYPLYYRSSNKQNTFSLIAELPLAFPVGKQRKYSDLGFTILGQIIENISGLPLDIFMEKNIFIPLGMYRTMYNPLQKNKNLKIAPTSIGNPYEKRMVYDSSLGFIFKEIKPSQWDKWRHYTLVGEVNDGNAWYANGGVSGAAGIFSDIHDLQILVDMLLQKGKVNNENFISEKTISTFLTKDSFNNGLGWMMDPINSFMKNAPEGSFGHTGFTGTSISVIPSQELSIIILINRQQMGLLPSNEYYNVNPIRLEIFKIVQESLAQ